MSAERSEAAAGGGAGGYDFDADAIERYVVKDPEAFARNLARMLEELGRAAAAWLGPRERGERIDTMSESVNDVVQTFSRITEYWLSDPRRALDAQTHLLNAYMAIWSGSMRRFAGSADGEAPAPDKRFKDEDWRRVAFFDVLRQVYVVTSKWAENLVDDAEGLDEHTRHKAAFYMKQVTSALSPANFVMTNPELYRETIAENGANLVSGMRMLAEDIAAGKGELRLRQTGSEGLALGETMATTPGKVVAQNELCQILQYAPSTETVLKRPLLVCPPWINKFYVLDLNAKKSFVKWAVDQGHTVFLISWVNPDERHASKDWEAYIDEGIRFALETVEAATGVREVNAIGYCVGGTLLSAALALMAKTGDERIRSVTLFATQVDFRHAGDLKVFADEEQIAHLEKTMARTGYLEGSKMSSAFNMLRASELIWPYVVNNYLKGKEPMPFDLLQWNSDSTRMTAANHSFYLRNCYLENNLSAGRMTLCGEKLSLKDVRIPVYNLATREDHIAPAKSVFIGSQFFGGEVTFVLSGSGHIAGVVNPPDRGKYQYYTGGPPVGDVSDWLENAEEHAGSWWPHWQGWIETIDGTQVKARKVGIPRRKPIEDAPGSYVREMA
ncbi:PHA/PHB synthase family protein [Pararhizobium mangrovi]|uniref:Class I poly(R)-hydroxyalkanoic acid synthase n=1 Tax=Pararhizobium mangrovi TaxID=2590452 RepID=A0A506TWB4_9HYPH|nr:class I poly(R)-hydroxyalkanoic acid synthase [Pararhizobium mangrovi]TPW26363.1 class I poly(R)-hydroxyalkanoic acid synthase [Pararhizobium mangrovi]